MDSALLELTGIYRGIVTTVDDPADQLRIKAKVPQAFGDDECEWALPAFPIGLSQLPGVNDPVWVMFEAGDPRYPVYLGSWKTLGSPVLMQGGTLGDIATIPVTGDELADFTIGITKFNDSNHHFNPPTLTSNSPSAGYISWSAFVMAYKGVQYTIAAGSTNQSYVYWTFGHSTLSTSSTLPAITVDDCLVFLNKSGVGFNAQLTEPIDGSLIVTGSIGTNQLAANSITATQIAAGAINGQVITGAIFQTAASGTRMVVAPSGSEEFIAFYAGLSGEQPGFISGGGDGIGSTETPFISIEAGVTVSNVDTAYINIIGESVDGTTFKPAVDIVAQDTVSTEYNSTVYAHAGPSSAAQAGIAVNANPGASNGTIVNLTDTFIQLQVQAASASPRMILSTTGLELDNSPFLFNGNLISHLAFGTYSVTTDSSSNFTITHGLAWTPTVVVFQATSPSTGANLGYPIWTAVSSTTITGRYISTSGSTATLAIQGRWIALA